MFKKELLFLVLGLAIASSCLAQSSAKPGDKPSRGVLLAYCDAWSTGGPDKAQAFYDKSSDDVFYDLAPLKYQGWSEYDAGVKQVLSVFESAKLVLGDDPAIHPAGNWAWTTSTFKLQGRQRNGNAVDLTGRWTAIWQKKAGKWLIVHEHVSVTWGGPEAENRQK
jgi:ketosteroid isomerase-like protein